MDTQMLPLFGNFGKPIDVRFTLNSDQIADILGRPSRAINGHRALSLDHLVGAGEYGGGQFQTEGFRGL